jgi:threonine dehydrogenase-like Zn-dependent dehydrogenase
MGPLGHEGGGTIVGMGPGVEHYLGGGRVKEGDRVGSLVYPTYTDYWVTSINNVQPIPDDVSFEVGCLYEPLGCAAWAAIHMGVKLGDVVAVNGVGFAGNIMLQGAVKAGASKVYAIDVVDAKLKIAGQLGAEKTINAKDTDPVEAINDLTGGKGVDIAVEAIGGTGDCLTGLLTALCGAGFKAIDAACLAAKTNRLAGHYANPNPATPVSELIDKIPQALSRLLGNEHNEETHGQYQKISECTK